jgi:hypothetical protein
MEKRPHLVGSADEIHVVFVEELADNLAAKGERDSAVVLAPAGRVLVRIGPQQIAEQACQQVSGREASSVDDQNYSTSDNPASRETEMSSGSASYPSRARRWAA